MDKIKTVKIKNEDGSISEETYTISVDALNVDMLRFLLMLELAGLLVDAIFYPIIYKYGCEKARFVLLSIII